MNTPDDFDEEPSDASTLRRLLDLALEELLRRTEVEGVYRYGPHTRTVYKDGRETIHTTRSYAREPAFVSPYEGMQLGIDIKDLYPHPAFPPWMLAAIGLAPLALGGILPLLKKL
jgi:hypothetical protein